MAATERLSALTVDADERRRVSLQVLVLGAAAGTAGLTGPALTTKTNVVLNWFEELRQRVPR